ncbi:hypothetical protein LQ327_09140 [Actinomycetospora endophytica]|uniref:Uncharacterized protein n=1 Tax=Actinomycetospora endophytica TaxID=2291215 RepID=A0ABS8P5L4_9PSEU|nr:hypothetical protein [Actinomycetospora endophytica]MCD2193547.1 hypothetical protein [Actinomycetospora endophytica]
MVESIGRAAGDPLFEIAVYRVTPRRWHQELDELDGQVHEFLAPDRDYLSESRYQERFERLQEAFRAQVGEFPYGQALGWLRLIHDGPGPAVKGYSYKLPQKRFQRRFQQAHFRATGTELEVSFRRSGTAADFVKELRAAIVATRSRGRIFEGRWLDMAAFDKVAPFVDWQGLLSPPG